MPTTITKQNQADSPTAPIGTDSAPPWHIIREYNNRYSCEELVRKLVRRQLELPREVTIPSQFCE